MSHRSNFLCLQCRQPVQTQSIYQDKGDFLMRGFCESCQKMVVVITGRGVGIVVDAETRASDDLWDEDWP